MGINDKLISIYLGNIDKEGRRIYTWKVLANKNHVSKESLSHLSSIRKHSTKEQFDIFLSCMAANQTVMLSNGTSSHNIAHIVKLLRKGHKIVKEGKRTSISRKNNSSLYLARCNNYYKIGTTLDSSIANRLAQLQIGNPYVIKLLDKTGIVKNAYELKKELHKMLKNKLVRGEWFKLEDKELKRVIKVFKEARELNDE